MRDFQSYREGFIAGIDLKENHKCQIMGYDLFEVLDLIQQHEEKKMKEMTIAEALEKTAHCKTLIESLEALGLIKFKEAEGIPLGFQFPFSKYREWEACIKALRDQGYKIIKDT